MTVMVGSRERLPATSANCLRLWIPKCCCRTTEGNLGPARRVAGLVTAVRVVTGATPAHSTLTYNDESSARFVISPSLRRVLDGVHLDAGIWLEVDGGIKVDNIADAARAGADTFVAGSAIFGSGDYKATIAAMRAELAKVDKS